MRNRFLRPIRSHQRLTEAESGFRFRIERGRALEVPNRGLVLFLRQEGASEAKVQDGGPRMSRLYRRRTRLSFGVSRLPDEPQRHAGSLLGTPVVEGKRPARKNGKDHEHSGGNIRAWSDLPAFVRLDR